MEKQFVPYELALKLKELGFNEECLVTMHSKSKDIIPIYGVYKENPKHTDFWIKAPLWQQAFDWFRDKHNLHALNSPLLNNEWSVVIDNTLNSNQVYWCIKLGYQEARLECLKKLIEIIEKYE